MLSPCSDASRAAFSMTALTAKDMAPTKIGSPALPWTRVSPDGGVVEPVRGVVRLGDDRIEGAAEQRRVHLVGDLLEAAFEDGEGDGVKHRALSEAGGLNEW